MELYKKKSSQINHHLFKKGFLASNTSFLDLSDFVSGLAVLFTPFISIFTSDSRVKKLTADICEGLTVQPLSVIVSLLTHHRMRLNNIMNYPPKIKRLRKA